MTDQNRDGSTDEGLAIQTLLREAVRATGASEATVWRFDEDGETIVAVRNLGPSAALIERERIPAHASVVGFVALMGMPMSIGPDDYQHPRIMAVTGTPVYAMLAVPIRTESDTIGTLSVVNTRSGETFPATVQSEVERIASRLAPLLVSVP